MYCLHCKYTTKLRNDKEINALFASYKGVQQSLLHQQSKRAPTLQSSHRLQKTSGARYSPTDCTDVHRLGGYGIPAIPTQPPNYLPTEFTEHTETTGGEEKSVYICEICGRLLSARRFCGFCVFRGRFLSEAMLMQRRPLHPLKIATLQQQDCHATTTRLPRYDNKVATLRQNVERRM